jgi:hypothetical protein
MHALAEELQNLFSLFDSEILGRWCEYECEEDQAFVRKLVKNITAVKAQRRT